MIETTPTYLTRIAAFIAASYFLVYIRRRSFKRESEELVDKVLQKQVFRKVKFHGNHELYIQDSTNALPLAVQRYLHAALSLIDDEDRGPNYMIHTPIAVANEVC